MLKRISENQTNRTGISVKQSIRLIIGILCALGLAVCFIIILSITSGCGTINLNFEISDFRYGTNSYQREYEQLLWPTVRVSTSSGCGSGVIVSLPVSRLTGQPEDRTTGGLFILTAAHVIGDENTVTVEFFIPGNTHPSPLLLEGNVALSDTERDLALIRIQTTDAHRLTQIYTARLAPRDYEPRLFTPVWAVGCSLGLHPRPSVGIISAITHPSPLLLEGNNSVSSVVEITAPILPGNSGGPVFVRNNGRYEVIGIAVSVCVYRNQLITTMAQVVPIQTIYEFLKPQITQIEISGIQLAPTLWMLWDCSDELATGNFQPQVPVSRLSGTGTSQIGMISNGASTGEIRPLNINLALKRMIPQAAPTLRSGQLAVTHFVLTASRLEVIYMARVTYTGGIQSIRGNIGNMVYKLWKTGVTTIQNKPTGVRNPGSSEQGSVRQLFSTMAKRWLQNLTQNDRDAWESLAKAGPYRINRESGVRAVIRTNNKKYSGKNAYLIYNALAASVGNSVPIDTPQLHEVPPLEPTTPTATYDGTKITITWGDIPNITPTEFVRAWVIDASQDFHRQMLDFAPAAAKTMNVTTVKGANGADFEIPRYEGGIFYIQLDTVSQATGLASAPSPCMVVEITPPAP